VSTHGTGGNRNAPPPLQGWEGSGVRGDPMSARIPVGRTDRIRILRVIARLNVGGPARHVLLLTARLDRDRSSAGRSPSGETSAAWSDSIASAVATAPTSSTPTPPRPASWDAWRRASPASP
jgi:hypothetical protein